jgi:HSP20 family protein
MHIILTAAPTSCSLETVTAGTTFALAPIPFVLVTFNHDSEGSTMNVIRYEPWSLINRLHQDLDRLVGREFGHSDDESRGAVSDWLPAVDVQEQPDAFLLQADLPGVDAKDIDITMENGVLSLRGRRHHETKQEESGYRRVERVSGEFFRRFTLPDSADPEAISAQMTNGVLTVRIGKRAEIQPRRIEVRSS